MCLPAEITFKKRLKGCTICEHVFVPQAVTRGGKDGVISLVCFRSVKQCQPFLRQYVCICVCIPDMRHNYLVIFVKLLILILQQVLYYLL